MKKSEVRLTQLASAAGCGAMQKLLEKCGFQYCGSFERLGMDKWMAYQKI